MWKVVLENRFQKELLLFRFFWTTFTCLSRKMSDINYIVGWDFVHFYFPRETVRWNRLSCVGALLPLSFVTSCSGPSHYSVCQEFSCSSSQIFKELCETLYILIFDLLLYLDSHLYVLYKPAETQSYYERILSSSSIVGLSSLLSVGEVRLNGPGHGICSGVF